MLHSLRAVAAPSEPEAPGNATAPDLCGANNSALYGPCIASDYKRLRLSGRLGPVYAGIPFALALAKQDAYGSTIASDSASLVQAAAPAAAGAVTGAAIAQLRMGEATLELAVAPVFAGVDFAAGNATVALLGQIALVLEGTDAQSGGAMLSGPIPLQVRFGLAACVCVCLSVCLSLCLCLSV